jgi:hypothetical protein
VAGGRTDRVAVIGARIAGLVTAKDLRDDGFDVVVFEKACAVGGGWIQSRTYPGLRTNNSRDTYGFTDHPYSCSADIFPTAEQVRRCLGCRQRLSKCRITRRDSRSRSAAGRGFSASRSCPRSRVRSGSRARCFTQARQPIPRSFAGRRVVVVGAGMALVLRAALDVATLMGVGLATERIWLFCDFPTVMRGCVAGGGRRGGARHRCRRSRCRRS